MASENVSIVDDGTMPGGWGTCPFDDEGYPIQKTPIVEKGVLRNFIYDTYTAMKANVESTGNAQRSGYWIKPQPSPNNLVLEKGKDNPEEMIKETKNRHIR